MYTIQNYKDFLGLFMLGVEMLFVRMSFKNLGLGHLLLVLIPMSNSSITQIK